MLHNGLKCSTLSGHGWTIVDHKQWKMMQLLVEWCPQLQLGFICLIAGCLLAFVSITRLYLKTVGRGWPLFTDKAKVESLDTTSTWIWMDEGRCPYWPCPKKNTASSGETTAHQSGSRQCRFTSTSIFVLCFFVGGKVDKPWNRVFWWILAPLLLESCCPTCLSIFSI